MNQQELKDHIKWLCDKHDTCVQHGYPEKAKILQGQIEIYVKELKNERRR